MAKKTDSKRPYQGLTRVGQLNLLANIAREVLPVTQAQQKMADAAVTIQQEPDAIERAYLARELVQCTLPHSDPGDLPMWTRSNGNLTLVVARTGFDRKTGKPIGYPYGTLPRLLMFWMNTEAVQKGSRRLEMGETFAQFIRAIGLDPGRGGPRSDYRRLQEQMRRLFSAAIGFQNDGEAENHSRREQGVTMTVTSRRELWWDPKQPDQIGLWKSWIELGHEFFEAITAAPVPGDLRALRALKRSPLALDLYIWAAHKAFSAHRKGNQFVPWAGLMRQFGSDYTSVKDFRKKTIAALRKIQTVYPGLRLRDAEGGVIVLGTSRPAVPPEKPSSRLLES